VIRSNMSARKCSMCSWVIEVTTVGMPRWTKAWKFQAHVKYESIAQAADGVHGARSASPEAEFPDRGMWSPVWLTVGTTANTLLLKRD
jgi:hypothetical protein